MTQDSIRFRLAINCIIFLAVLIFGTIIFMSVENRSLIDSFYYIIVTMATVGYGDIVPATPAGKIIAILLIITGVSTFLGVIANATELMLSRREKMARMKKLNMVIGVFFSEAGNHLIRIFARSDPRFEEIQKGLIITVKWTREDFLRVNEHLHGSKYSVQVSQSDLQSLKDFLVKQRDFLVRLLENPTLLEHESFTDLLRAVFHRAEELAYRDNLNQSPVADRAHLTGDINRAYHLLVHQWLDYMEYLKIHYPYLFSLAMRTNPFDLQASPVIAHL
ncbi:MAG: two pore domain potassium channel family protein [Desulfobacterales bacterium CG07_land_8_20_14_0_80_52_14]|nr:MAG: ion transporter [Desulfobacterales bacterium CG23_combo_of_CG06-09_8_20_14_all_52_9]PIU49148.1 MAG: two pore domain potassium channel family protein [Desulfobacterales bacterium CG07_land_8_20_14_0_80_52_14]